MNAADQRLRLPADPPEEVGLLMTSMIDVIFILLAAFLCVSELKKGKLSVDVPEVPTAETADSDAGDEPLVIEVTSEDSVYVAGELARDAEELELLLEQRALALGAEVPVHLSGDKQATNGAMMRVVSRLSQAGFKRIEFAVEPGE